MFYVVKVRQKRGGFRILQQTKFSYLGVDFTLFSLPPLLNKKKKEHYSMYFSAYRGKLLFQKNFPFFSLEESAFSPNAFGERILLAAFLRYCKQKKPPCVTIAPAGKMHPDYLCAIAPFVGRILCIGVPANLALCQSLLEKSGTPLFFVKTLPEDTAFLNLDKSDYKMFHQNGPYFSLETFLRLSVSLTFPPPLDEIDPLTLSAALFEKTNRPDLKEKWVEAILRLF